jgi:hypothetical protein
MSVQRYISSSFWSDDWVDTLTVHEKLIYMYLLTNDNTNAAGIYRITIKRMKDETGIGREGIANALDHFATDRKAFYINEYIIIPKWPKHQRLGERGKLKLGADAVLKALPEEIKLFISTPGNYEYDLSFLNINPDRLSGKQEKKGYTIPKNEENPIDYPEKAQNPDRLSDDSDLDSEIDNIKEFTPQVSDPPASPTADAVDQKDAFPVSPKTTAIVPASQSPPAKMGKKRGIQLTEDQLVLFHAAKACFETDLRTKAIMYQDKGSAQMHMENLKKIVVWCANMVPMATADFMRNVLEHFKVIVNGKLKGKAEFTPRALITPWIWEMVIGSLPENNVSEEMRESIRGMFNDG